MRWSLYGLAFVFLVTSILSGWFEFGARITYVRQLDPAKSTSAHIGFDSGRVTIGFIPDGGYELFWQPSETGSDTHAWWVRINRYKGKIDPRSPFYPKHRWWSAPSFTRYYANPTGWNYEQSIPMVYPTLLMSVFAFIVWRRQRGSVLAGCCPSCGYSLEGLTSTTCPECGETITHA